MTNVTLSALWTRSRVAAAAACTASLLLASPALAEYPDRDIKMIIPFGVGGGSDTLARTIANVIGELKDAVQAAAAATRLRVQRAESVTFVIVHSSRYFLF